MACWRTKCRRPWTPDLLEVNSMKQSNIEIFDRNGRLSTKLPRSLSEVTCRLFSPIRSQLLDMKGRQASEKFFISNLNLRPPLQSAEGSSHAWECAAKSAGCVFWAADRESRWRNADHGNAASSSYEFESKMFFWGICDINLRFIQVLKVPTIGCEFKNETM